MASASSAMQKAAQAHAQHGRDKPEWMNLALDAINLWGRQEHTLAHAVALALEEAYRRGEQGKYPVGRDKKLDAVDAVLAAKGSTIVRRRSKS